MYFGQFKVAPYSFSVREEWELNWHKRAREERDSPSQMTCANQPPGRTGGVPVSRPAAATNCHEHK